MTHPSENLSLSEIAYALGVRPSAVSNWRKRHEDTFPKPRGGTSGRPLFSLREVTAWAQQSGVASAAAATLADSRDADPTASAAVELRAIARRELDTPHVREAIALSAILHSEKERARAEFDLDRAWRSLTTEPKGSSAEAIIHTLAQRVGVTFDAQLPLGLRLMCEYLDRHKIRHTEIARILQALEDQRDDVLGAVQRAALSIVSGEGTRVNRLLLMNAEGALAASGRAEINTVMTWGDEHDYAMLGSLLARGQHIELRDHGARVNEDALAADRVLLFPPLTEKLILVRSQLPEPIPLSESNSWGELHGRQASLAWIQQATMCMASNGIAVVLTRADNLAGRSGEIVRRRLTESGMLRAIVTLEVGPNSRIGAGELALWVLGSAANAGQSREVYFAHIAQLGELKAVVKEVNAVVYEDDVDVVPQLGRMVSVDSILSEEATLGARRWLAANAESRPDPALFVSVSELVGRKELIRRAPDGSRPSNAQGGDWDVTDHEFWGNPEKLGPIRARVGDIAARVTGSTIVARAVSDADADGRFFIKGSNGDVIAITDAGRESWDPAYIALCLMSADSAARLGPLARHGDRSLDLMQMRIPVRPIEDQRAIVAEWTDRQSEAQQLRARAARIERSARAVIDALYL